MVIPRLASEAWARASEILTLPKPMGLVGGLIVVFEPVVPLGVSVIEDPVRSPVTKALALSVEPAKVLNCETSLLVGVELALVEVDPVVVPVVPVVVSAAKDGVKEVNKARLPVVKNVSIESFGFMCILLNE